MPWWLWIVAAPFAALAVWFVIYYAVAGVMWLYFYAQVRLDMRHDRRHS